MYWRINVECRNKGGEERVAERPVRCAELRVGVLDAANGLVEVVEIGGRGEVRVRVAESGKEWGEGDVVRSVEKVMRIDDSVSVVSLRKYGEEICEETLTLELTEERTVVDMWDMLRITVMTEAGSFSNVIQREEVVPPVNLNDVRRSPGGREFDWMDIEIRAVTDSAVYYSGFGESGILDLENPQMEFEDIGVGMEIVGYSVAVYESNIYNELKRYEIDADDWENMETDEDVAFEVAKDIERQTPSELEIIAGYMEAAWDLGSKKAEEWLRDYHYDCDARWHAYD